MTLPVSKYEELLRTVRCLKQQTIRVRALASPLLDTIVTANERLVSASGAPAARWGFHDDDHISLHDDLNDFCSSPSSDMMDPVSGRGQSPAGMSLSSEPAAGVRPDLAMLYHGTWPGERAMWNSEPLCLRPSGSHTQVEVTSVMSFASSSGATPLDRVLSEGIRGPRTAQQLEVKVDMVYSLLSMLGTQECPDMGETLLALSSSPESSLAMRQAGCLPVLVQLVYSDKDKETRTKASKALYNLIQVQSDDKLRKREVKVIRLLDEIRAYCDLVPETPKDEELFKTHPTQVTENIIKLSFDEGYRQTICELGGIYALAHLVEADHAAHPTVPEEEQCVLIRRYAGMALTNLTFGHSQNKALLCSFRDFMKCLVAQLQSHSDELRQVTASVIRNLSWRADASSRLILREVGSVPALMTAAIISHKESTLKSILSALWNLSAHCSMNKADICSVEGALGFLVDMLSYKPPSKTLAIIENAGGILRNISSHVAVREDYRAVLRQHNCLSVLLQQLKSPSLTIVSNACGTLWNLSAKCVEDQKALWDLGAAPMLRSLNHSKHIMIATGSRAALKNLLSSRPTHNLFTHVDTTAKELGLPILPTLGARKQRALAKELDQNLSETCENIEPPSSLFCESGKSNRKFNYPIKDDNTTPHSIFEGQRLKSDLVSSFNSLSLNDKCSSHSDINSSRKTYTQNGFSSLTYPNQNCRMPATFPVRSNYPERSFDDICDQPVDYSQKYTDTNNYVLKTEIKTEFPDEPVDYSKKYSEPKNYAATKTEFSEEPIDYSKKYSKSPEEFEPVDYSKKYTDKNLQDEEKISPKGEYYTDYAETDLDQPTNYSLRYGEDDSDPEELKPVRTERFYEEPDTLKTYYTEGTPYETPLNFSTATSLSDLRIDSNVEEKTEQVTKEEVKVEEKPEIKEETIEPPTAITPNKKQSCYSSGLMSPEKPVNYCDEGTPGYFSRVSSLSSLNVTGLETANVEEQKLKVEDVAIEPQVAVGFEEETGQENATVDEDKIENKADREAGKVVTFGRVVDHYAEETPLMFSRCSSLGSLSSTEQHSIHDDRSSVSDFSRLTSGIISPSEIPDSPTQTVPPSPRHRKAPEFPPAAEPAPGAPRSSVFEDQIIKYKEANTPVDFSTNTSLSSLTIDDEPSVPTKLTLLQNGTIQRQNIDEGNSSVMEKQSSSNDDKNTDKPSDSNVELSTVSEGEEEGEEDILAACIKIGMQNNRHRQNKLSTTKLPSPSNKNSPPRTGIPIKSSPSRLPMPESRIKPLEPTFDTVRTYHTENTPAVLSNAGSHSDLSVLSFSSKPNAENDDKPDLSDDSSNFSGDNDNILAECIQSGISKVRRQIIQPRIPVHKVKPSNELLKNNRNDLNLPKNVPYFDLRDEIASYAVEGSPGDFSLRSSLSDLTVEGNVTARRKDEREVYVPYAAPRSKLASIESLPRAESSYRSVDSDLTNEEQALLEQCISAGMSKSNKISKETPLVRRGDYKISSYNERKPDDELSGSLSSLSVESCGSLENAALLEQCILSGISTKTKITPVSESKFTGIPKPGVYSSAKPSHSKNVYVTSVVTSTTQQTGRVLSPQTTQAADVEIHTDTANIQTTPITASNDIDADKLDNNAKNGYNNCDINNFLQDNMFSATKNEYDIINKCSDVLTDCSIEDNVSPDVSDSESKSKQVKNRMLDPDAMIESLDRFTAELVSHSSHLNSHECKPLMNQSINDGDTWNEDTSPNDVSFPSISISAPLVASFKSETSSKYSDVVDGKGDSCEKDLSNQFSSMNTMTESTIIAMEATKISNVVHSEVDMLQSVTSMHSLDLEHINPPSMMESIISFTSSFSPKQSPLPNRKKSLPPGLMVRRALGNSTQAKSLENLDTSVSSSCNLEQIKPPSVMGDYLDMIDMESSMISVASITSEIAEPCKIDFVANGPVTKELHVKNWHLDIKQPTFSHTSDIENINPPSLLNEVTDLCNSTADVITENIYSDDIFEDCFTHTLDQTLQPDNTLTADEITEYSDANSVTPVQSDFNTSSTESTPKKTKNVNKRLTPKQKRQLAKERYKTYTVAAEMVIREELNRAETITESPDSSAIQSLETSMVSSNSSSGSPKLTPKERRLLDRERFQTRVLEKSPEINCENPQENKFATFDRTNIKNEGEKIIIKRPISSLQMSLSKLDIQKANSIYSSKSNESPSMSVKNDTSVINQLSSIPMSSQSAKNDVTTKDIRKTILNQSSPSPPMSPQSTRNKTDIRKAMQQKRLENKDRFRTRTISGESNSPETLSPGLDRRMLTAEELHSMLEHETNIILNTLEQNTSSVDDYIDCETLSLVSNEDDSEHNSVSSVNYRTYHKSWGFNKQLPVVQATVQKPNLQIATQLLSVHPVENDSSSESEEVVKIIKPKIVKPTTEKVVVEEIEDKTVRGKKKAYISPYRSTNAVRNKQVKNVTSSLVKNVTSSLTNKSSVMNRTNIIRNVPKKPEKPTGLKPPTGYNAKTTPNRSSLPKMSSPQKQSIKRQSLPIPSTSQPKMERQGTFVKDEPKTDQPNLTSPSSRIARAIIPCKSKSASSLKPPQKIQSKTITSTTATKNPQTSRSTFSSRSPSADRDFVSKVKKAAMPNSTSSQSLQSQEGSKGKRSSIPSMTQRSDSNVSVSSGESTGKKKQVTSKIASLWKRVEESKKKLPEKKDTKKWITPVKNTPEVSTCDSTTIVSF